MKVIEIQNIYNALSVADTKGMSVDEKYKSLILVRNFKKVVDEFQSFISDLKEKDMTDEEKNQIIEKEAFREIEDFKYERLGDAFDKLMAANDWTLGQIEILEKILK